MSQKIYFGYGVYKQLESILQEFSPHNPFLVTDRNAFRLSGAENLLREIFSKYQIIKFDNFELNPKLDDIKKGIKLFNEGDCDFIIGVGGGSSMDMAKAISILAIQRDDLKEIIENGTLLSDRTTPSVMIPTTAGTGSESTHFSVVYIDKTKYSLAHHSILSDYVLLDPTFTENLPPYITAYTAMDALCQAIESYWSVKSSDESRQYSEKAIELIMPNIVNVVNNPNRASREKMLIGSNLAGKAINIAKTTASHSISYPMTSYFGIPHGHAVALTLPYFIEYNSTVDSNTLQDERGVEFVKERLNELNCILNVTSPKEARDMILELMIKINLDYRLSDLGICDDCIEILIENGFNPERVKNNPKVLSKQDLRNILKKLK